MSGNGGCRVALGSGRSGWRCTQLRTQLRGGWGGHRPDETARLLADALGERAELADSLDVFRDAEQLRGVDLVVPVWTMGTIEPERLDGLLGAVAGGVGLDGYHGMCDAFRGATEYQFPTGGQFVGHPGGDAITHTIRIVVRDHPITRGLGADWGDG